MNTLEYYMNLSYKMEIIKDEQEGGYTVAFPDLKGCLTCGNTIEQAIINAEDAKREWFIACMEINCPIPEPSNLKGYSGQFKLRIPKSLHKELAENAKAEGVSMNQYCATILAKNV